MGTRRTTAVVRTSTAGSGLAAGSRAGRTACLVALSLLASIGPAARPAYATQSDCDPARVCFVLDPDESMAWFDAGSSMGSFRGESRDLRGWGETVDVTTFARPRGRLELPVASIATGIGLRNRHMRSELRADTYPLITFELTAIDSDPDAAENHRVLIGRLTIRETTRTIRVLAVVEAEPDVLRATGEYPTRFTDWGLDPPTRMLGIARVSDILVLGFDLVFRPVPDRTSPGAHHDPPGPRDY